MITSPAKSVNYYVVFTKSKSTHFIFKYLDPFFAHCYAIKRSDCGQYWIIIDPMFNFLDILQARVEDYPSVRLLCKPSDIILKVTSMSDTVEEARFGLLNCVSIVKMLLSINKFWVLTPRQLYKYLIREGKKNG